jgi:hypothetical protein
MNPCGLTPSDRMLAALPFGAGDFCNAGIISIIGLGMKRNIP